LIDILKSDQLIKESNNINDNASESSSLIYTTDEDKDSEDSYELILKSKRKYPF